MGHGLILRCEDCGFEMRPHLGVGFMFPKVYQETVEEAKKGKYGETLQAFLEDHPDGAINCETVLLQCSGCGALETGPDLSMYVPKQDINPKEKGKWSVAFPFEGAAYVSPRDLDQYELVSHYAHICGKCGKKMKTFNEKDMEKKLGSFFFCGKHTDFACPECGNLLRNTGDIMWD